MEQLNSKLFDKYQNLKKRKLIEEEEWGQKKLDAIKNYQLDVEDLIEELRSENDRLRTEIISLHEKYNESQKLVLEESQNVKELSNEVGKLQSLLSKKNDIGSSASPRSPYTNSRSRSRNAYKRSSKKKTPNSCDVQSEVQSKEATSNHYENHQEERLVPVCCRKNIPSSEGAMSDDQLTCTFQSLLQFLVSMKFSLELEADGLCILAVHQKTGYTFTLRWVRHEDGGDGEMWYRVSTLGTLERIALDWMKEEMIFSVTMLSVFFERIKRVLGRS